MTLLVDFRTGSRELAFYEPIRSMLSICPSCSGGGEIKTTQTKDKKQKKRLIAVGSCNECHYTGRVLDDLSPDGDDDNNCDSSSAADVALVGRTLSGPIRIGIEMMSVSDLIGKLNTGRLQATQLPAMARSYDQIWLLICGQYRPSPIDLHTLQTWHDADPIKHRRAGWYDCKDYRMAKWKKKDGQKDIFYYSYIESFLSGPSIRIIDEKEIDINIKRVNDIQEAAIWISVLHKTWTKDPSKHKSMKVFDKSAKIASLPTSRDEKTDSINRCARFGGLILSGLGWTKSQLISKYFEGSIKRMVNAGADELMKIKGIGPTIAKSIEKEVNPYND